MQHKIEIKEKPVEGRPHFYVMCSCGYEDPKPGSLLTTRGDADASKRQHEKDTHTDRDFLIRQAGVMWDGFYRCPTTGRIIEAMSGDDKVLCGCRKSNPKCPSESTEQTGVHIRRFLSTATATEYVDQGLARKATK